MINILVFHNPDRPGCKVLQHFEENWKRVKKPLVSDQGDTMFYEDGEPMYYFEGLNPSLAEVPVKKIQIKKGAERIQLIDTKDKTGPLFTLEGPKALQLNVLEDYLQRASKSRKMIIGISGKIGSGKDLVGNIIRYLTMKPTVKSEWIEMQNGDPTPIVIALPDNIDDHTNWKVKRFADSLKDMVCILLGCTREQLEDREFKEKELGEEWNCFVENSTFDERFKLLHISEPLTMGRCTYRKMTPRLLLQLIGTECGRDILHPNIWVNALFSTYGTKRREPRPGDYMSTCYDCGDVMNGVAKREPYCKACSTKIDYPNWIITDMRFPNELEAVKEKGGITIRINRPQAMESIGMDVLNAQTREITEVYRKVEHPSETALDNAEFDYTIINDSSIEDLIHTVKLILEKEKIL